MTQIFADENSTESRVAVTLIVERKERSPSRSLASLSYLSAIICVICG